MKRRVLVSGMMKGVSIIYNATDGIEKLLPVTAEEEIQHLQDNLHLKVIRKLTKIFEGPW